MKLFELNLSQIEIFQLKSRIKKNGWKSFHSTRKAMHYNIMTIVYNDQWQCLWDMSQHLWDNRDLKIYDVRRVRRQAEVNL